jgi:hypothetical protein
LCFELALFWHHQASHLCDWVPYGNVSSNSLQWLRLSQLSVTFSSCSIY